MVLTFATSWPQQSPFPDNMFSSHLRPHSTHQEGGSCSDDESGMPPLEASDSPPPLENPHRGHGARSGVIRAAGSRAAGRTSYQSHQPHQPSAFDQPQLQLTPVVVGEASEAEVAAVVAALAARYTASLAAAGLELRVQASDGNCLFRSVAVQVTAFDWTRAHPHHHHHPHPHSHPHLSPGRHAGG